MLPSIKYELEIARVNDSAWYFKRYAYLYYLILQKNPLDEVSVGTVKPTRGKCTTIKGRQSDNRGECGNPLFSNLHQI